MKNKLQATLVVLVVLAILAGAFWFFIGFMFDSAHMFWRFLINEIWVSWLFPHGWKLWLATPLFWILVAAVVITIAAAKNSEGGGMKALVALFSIGALVATGFGLWNINKSAAEYYTAGGSAEFVVNDAKNAPDLLRKVESSNKSLVDITEGNIDFNWEKRIASASGALYVMKRTGDTINNTELMSDTIAYSYGDGDNNGSWTAIRNGIHKQSIYGVATWKGTGEKVSTCQFKGDYKLDRSFGNMWGKNLNDDIAQANPLFKYDSEDVHGYCDGDEPVIVIAGTKTIGAGLRTVDQNYGVMTIHGSKSGAPVIEHIKKVSPGDFPIPVYPTRLTNSQMGYFNWSAGRCWTAFSECFGLSETDVFSQSAYSSNFLLKNKDDGRLYWVTPLKPASADSQTLVAYSIIAADQANGALNKQKVYVMDSDNTDRIVNLDTLENEVVNSIRDIDPGFFTGEHPGQIVEFLPVTNTDWQVYAETGGRVKYRIDVNTASTLTTKVMNISHGTDKPAEQTDPASDPSDVVSCDNPSALSDSQIAECIGSLANELKGRSSEK